MAKRQKLAPAVRYAGNAPEYNEMDSLDRLLLEKGRPEQDRRSAATDIVANFVERTKDLSDILHILQTKLNEHATWIERESKKAR